MLSWISKNKSSLLISRLCSFSVTAASTPIPSNGVLVHRWVFLAPILGRCMSALVQNSVLFGLATPQTKLQKRVSFASNIADDCLLKSEWCYEKMVLPVDSGEGRWSSSLRLACRILGTMGLLVTQPWLMIRWLSSCKNSFLTCDGRWLIWWTSQIFSS